MELEIIIRIRNIMLLRIHILRRNLNSLIRRPHIIGSRNPLQAPTIRIPTPRGIHLSQILIVTPVPRLNQLQQSGTIRPWLRTENPPHMLIDARRTAISERMRPHEILLHRLIRLRHQLHRIIQQRQHVRERIPEKPGNPYRRINPWPTQLRQRNQLQIHDAPGCLIPHRPHPQ